MEMLTRMLELLTTKMDYELESFA